MDKHDKFKLTAAYIDNNLGLIQDWIDVEKIARAQSGAQGVIVPSNTPAISFLGFWADQCCGVKETDFRPIEPFIVGAIPEEFQTSSKKNVFCMTAASHRTRDPPHSGNASLVANNLCH